MKTQFKGNPLIEIPKNIPIYNFLIGDFGKEFLEEYNRIVKSDYKDNSNLKVLNFEDNVVKGSNSYSIFLADKILSQYGLKTATPLDVQKIIDKDEDFLRGFYVDLGIVLRTEDSPNEHFLKQLGNLGKQTKERGYKFSKNNPLVFRASDLELILDKNYLFGLGFKIKEPEFTNPFHAPELSNKKNKRFYQTNQNGIPIFDKNGDRILYTRKECLTRFVLSANLNLDFGSDYLVDSDEGGRVVVVKEDK